MNLQNSPIQKIIFRDKTFFIKRDDLLDRDFSGNKARKFYFFFKNEFSNIKRVISYGSNQSNAMYSISLLAEIKGWDFIYFVNHIPSYLKENPIGNYKYALLNGMNIVDDRKEIEKIEKELNRYIPILSDLQGPKFRIDISKRDFLEIKDGEIVKLYLKKVDEEGNLILDHPQLKDELKRGDKIYIEDGKIRLVVEEIFENHLKCVVLKGGRVFKKKGVNFPDVPLKLPSLTEKDRRDVENSLKYRVDYFCLSFVRKKEDVLEIKKIAKHVKII